MKLGSFVIGIILFSCLLLNIDSLTTQVNKLDLAADASTQLDVIGEKDSLFKEIVRPTFMKKEQLNNAELPIKRISYLFRGM